MVMAVKIKVMPSSPNANLEKIKKETKEIIIREGGKNCSFEEEPIAFGLKALIALFLWSEEKSLDELEKKLEKIEDISSIQVIDIRKAFG